MSNKEMTSIALKVFAIYVMVQSILVIPSFFQAYIMLGSNTEYNSSSWFVAVSSVSIIFLLILSIFIWKLSEKLTSRMDNKSNDNTSNISEEFILSVLGIYVIFHGLSNLAFSLSAINYSIQNGTFIDNEVTHRVVYLIVYILQSIVGITLIIRSNGWASFLKTIRRAGTQ